MSRKLLIISIFIAVTGLFSACSNNGKDTSNLETQLETIRLTATAGANDDGPGGAVITAQVKGTATAVAIQEQQVTIQVQQEEVNSATAQAAAPIQAELDFYGVDPDKGKVAYIHPPVTLEVDEFHGSDFSSDYPGVVAADFVLSSDITWNTQYGTSGCGYLFRADGNQDKPSQYMALITRGGTGHVVFLVLDEGELAAGYDIYTRTEDPGFDFHNDATNSLTIVGRGNIFDIYTNGNQVGSVDVSKPPVKPAVPPPPPLPTDQKNLPAMQAYRETLKEYQDTVSQLTANFNARLSQYQEGAPLYERGFVAMLTLSESGNTVCKFDDTWLWLIEE